MLDEMLMCRHLENILRSPVRLYNAQSHPRTQAENNQEDPLVCDPGFTAHLLALRNEDRPVLFEEMGHFLYAIIPSRDHETFILGPVCYENLPAKIFKTYASAHHLKAPQIYRISQVPTDIIFECILLLFHFNSPVRLSREELLMQNTDVNIVLDIRDHAFHIIYDKREHETTHNSYTQEVREQTAIRDGDLDALWKSWADLQEGLIGRLGKDGLSHHRNLATVVIALACRSAIEGGVLPEIAYSLADSYTLQASTMTNIVEITKLYRAAELHYTRLVKEARSNSIQNRYVRRARELVHDRLHQRLLVADIAVELGLSRSYLSQIFLQEEGMTLSSYIHQEKIKASQHLLAFSDESIEQIAAVFGFSSQSHFGQIFSKYTGMSPGKYREKYHRQA